MHLLHTSSFTHVKINQKSTRPSNLLSFKLLKRGIFCQELRNFFVLSLHTFATNLIFWCTRVRFRHIYGSLKTSLKSSGSSNPLIFCVYVSWSFCNNHAKFKSHICVRLKKKQKIYKFTENLLETRNFLHIFLIKIGQFDRSQIACDK